MLKDLNRHFPKEGVQMAHKHVKKMEIQTTMINYLFVHIFMYSFCTRVFIAALLIIA